MLHAGITIEFADPVTGVRRTATFLPEVAAHQGWDRRQALDNLIQKSGYGGQLMSRVRQHVKLTRYQSTTCTLTYEEYCKLKGS